jgi:hypothetical protein
MLALLTLATLCLADEKDGVYALPDAGVTLDAPSWHMTRWSDWDWKARTQDGAVVASVNYTAYQIPIDESTREAIIASWKARLTEEEHAQDVVFSAATVTTEDGRAVLKDEASFRLASGQRASFYGAAIASEGRTVHLATYAVGANSGRAKAGLDGLVARLKVDREAADLGSLSSELRTKTSNLSLPTGWRRPTDGEATDVQGLYARTLVTDPSKCVSAIHVPAPGAADLALLCEGGPSMGILDDYSFTDLARLFTGQLFGKSAEKVAAPEKVPAKDGPAVLLKANDGLYVAGLPTKEGSAVAWFAGRADADAEMASAAKAMVGSWAIDPSAKPAPELGAVIAHTLTYNPTHPVVLFAGLLMMTVMGGLGFLVFKKSPQQELPSY